MTESPLAENGPEFLSYSSESDGLIVKLIAKVGLQAGVASNCNVGGVTVLHDDEASLAVSVETVGICQELVHDPTIDPEQVVGGELEHHPTTTLKVEHAGELLGVNLVPEGR